MRTQQITSPLPTEKELTPFGGARSFRLEIFYECYVTLFFLQTNGAVNKRNAPIMLKKCVRCMA